MPNSLERKSRLLGSGEIDVSFEFFPPKSEKMEASLWTAVERLAPLHPEFVSVTYGAGGSTRERTHATVTRIIRETELKPAAHLTCVAASRTEVDAVARAYWDEGVRHIVALRGDSIAGPGTRYEPHPGGYVNAADLVAGLKKIAGFEISVAGYPEKHPDSPTLAADMDNLKAKVDAGADRIITQFGFDNAHYLRFLERARAAGIWVPITPGIVPIHNFKQVASFAARGRGLHALLARAALRRPRRRFRHEPSRCGRRSDGAGDGPRRRGREEIPLLYSQPRRPRVRHLPSVGAEAARGGACGRRARGSVTEIAQMKRKATYAALEAAANERILIMDGAMGTMIQRHKLTEEGYRGQRFKDWTRDVKGNNDLLVLTQPKIISDIHESYLEAGADILETNTFNAQKISLADYGMEELAYEINVAAAKIARVVADTWTKKTPDKPRFVAGAVGPTNRTASISPDVNDPGFRNVSFDVLREAYKEQIAGLIDGGADIILIETIFDTLNAKAAGVATLEVFDEKGIELPIMVSGTITDRSGRTLSGQTPEAFWYSMRHLKPFSIGLNCALGAELMRPYLAELAAHADTRISAYPNAGLPNPMGEYDETPDDMACQMEPWAKDGIVNIVGGCCGSTPDHIRHIGEHVARFAPRKIPKLEPRLRLSGLEPFVHG